MIDSCRLRKPAAGLIATYCSPILFSTSAMKSEPGCVMKVSLGSLVVAGLAAGFAPSVVTSAAAAILAPAATAAPAAAALFRNERRLGLPVSSSFFFRAAGLAG